MQERKRLLAEVPASTLGPGVSYLAEHVARWLKRDGCRGTVWLDLGTVDVTNPHVQHQLANADLFRQQLRMDLGVVVHQFQLGPV